MFTRIKNDVVNQKREEGFTLVEVVLSMGIIAITLTLFALMLTNSANLQSDLNEQRIAERILYGESEEIASMRWDNIMPSPAAGSFATCQLDGDTYSTQAVNAGPETITVDNLEVSITRTIEWYISGASVECTAANKFRAEPKKITINATWDGRTGTKTKSLVIIRSRWAEAPLSSENRGRIGERTSIVYAEDFSSSASWCNPYLDDSGATINPGAAALANGGITLTFGSNSEGICGIEITGLTPGTLYTAVASVSVPSSDTEVTISSYGQLQGGLALPGGGTTILTTSWVEYGTSRLVGISIPDASENSSGDIAVITQFRVFANN